MTMVQHGVQPRKVDIIHAVTQSMQPGTAPKTSIWLSLIPAATTGGFLWMCYFPLAWGWLGWIALVPLLALVRMQQTPRRLYLSAWLGGLVFFVPALHWLSASPYQAMTAAWIMLALYCALYFPATLWLIRFVDRKTWLPLAVAVPVAWTLMEWFRSFMLTGFAWYYLGHTQHAMLPLIQIADLGGVYLISFVIAAVNAWVFDVLYQFPGLRDRFRWREPRHLQDGSRPLAGGSVWRPGLIYEAGVLFLAVLCTYIYGTWRLGQNRFDEGPLLALLQTNLGQEVRDDVTQEERDSHLARHCDRLCRLAVHQPQTPDLIVWPETSYLRQFPWLEISAELPIKSIPQIWREDYPAVRRHLREELLRFYPANHLLGLSTYVLNADGTVSRFNSALLVPRDGLIGERYDKMHRVPWGEFVPFRDSLPFMEWLSPYDFNYDIHEGETFTRFEAGKHKYGVLICYEDSDPFLPRRYVRSEKDGEPVDFLINISNDGWFNGTVEHEEHLAISRFRAIECRRAIARSVNMGISAVIDGNGRVLRPEELPPPEEPHTWRIAGAEELPIAEWASYKKTAGVLLARVPIDSRASFYAAAGDWLPIGCCGVVAAVIVWSIARRRRTPQTGSQTGPPTGPQTAPQTA